MLGSIEDSIAEQEAYESGLKQQQGAFESRLYDSRKEYTHLEKFCLGLKSKVDRWEEHFKKRQEIKEQESIHIQKELARRVSIQTRNATKNILLKEIISQAIPQARKELETQYANKTNVEHYMENILSLMKKDTN